MLQTCTNEWRNGWIIRSTKVRNSFKKIANHKLTALELQLSFTHLVEKIHQDNITRHISSTRNQKIFYPFIINKKKSTEIDNLTVDDIQTLEQTMAYGINVVRHKHSNKTNFRELPLFIKFCKKMFTIRTQYI